MLTECAGQPGASARHGEIAPEALEDELVTVLHRTSLSRRDASIHGAYVLSMHKYVLQSRTIREMVSWRCA